MTREPEASQALLAARRALEGMKRVTLIQDWIWNVSWNRWVLCCSLTREQTGDSTVPVKTTWYFLVDTTYPWGTVKCYPAKQDGLVQTFPHQQYNGSTHDDVPWRDGDICLGTGLRILVRHDYDTEPYNIHQRLRWYVQRALDWLDAAAQGSLVQPGDPFELPPMPRLSTQSTTIAFCEDPDSFLQWKQTSACCGLVDFLRIRTAPQVLLVKRFRPINTRVTIETSWGRSLEQASMDLGQGQYHSNKDSVGEWPKKQ